MGCGAKCLKVILITVNIIFFLAGAAICGVGIWLRVDPNLSRFKGDTSLLEFQQALYTAAYVLIAFGGFTLLVAFSGCCGAMKDSKCLLGLYITFVLAILGAEIGGGVYAYVQRGAIEEKFNELAFDYLHNEYTGNSSDADTAWNFVMVTFDCCGVSTDQTSDGATYTFGSSSKFSNTFGSPIPPACCAQEGDNLAEVRPKDMHKCSSKLEEYYNGVGCNKAVIDFVTERSTILLGVAAGVAGFELLVLLSAICYCRNMDKED